MEASASARPPALEFRHVTLELHGKTVLSDVSFQLERGQMIILTGRSSSGKSVLVHTAVGFFRPDEGEVLVDGRHIEKLGEEELLDLRSSSIGLVFQEDALFSSLTVYENAAYRLVEHDRPPDETDRVVHEILTFVGLDADAAKLPEELSIGMRRRLEIARALAGWPPLMLFDEATTGLDPLTARKILDLAIRARDVQRISSLYVTKELREIPYLAGHLAVEHDGTVEIREGARHDIPPTKVIVIRSGEIAFFGTVPEFETSTLEAVVELTGAPTTTSGRRPAFQY
jgi:phospholipid/cholesterol/gamma-HCH transport system ATP-binding protein